MLMSMVMIVTGSMVLQYLPQPIMWPLCAAMDTPTTFAEAPMGVALPPMSVPQASVQESTDKSIPVVAARDSITGIMVAAKGILSTNALAMADTQRITAIITYE